MYFIEIMYILLHRNYEIVFFESEFPTSWNPDYFEVKQVMIKGIVPGWSLS
jgi:hypothetical protein